MTDDAKKKRRRRRNVSFTNHALERYIERVRPGMTLEEARTDLYRMRKDWNITEKKPSSQKDVIPDQLYLRIGQGDDVVFTIIRKGQSLLVTTCLTSDLLVKSKKVNNKQASSRKYRQQRIDKKVEEHAIGDFQTQWQKLQDLRAARTESVSDSSSDVQES